MMQDDVRICTNLEEIEELLSLGINPSTASMKLKSNSNKCSLKEDDVNIFGEGFLPSWTLADLINIVPKTLYYVKNGVVLSGDLTIIIIDNKWTAYYTTEEGIFKEYGEIYGESEQLVKAMVYLIKKLIENELIDFTKLN